jgi:hypothetical protein
VYEVGDLFYTGWEQLSGKVRTEVYGLIKAIDNEQLTVDNARYGFMLIRILKLLVKNQDLVDKIDVAQAVDIFNSLSFLRESFYMFPDLTPALSKGEGEMQTPDGKMERNTFAHFIYADNEYTKYLALRQAQGPEGVNLLKRLVATLYQSDFDEEEVEPIANKLKLKEWQLMHVFFSYAQVREFVMERCKTLLPTHGPLTPEGGTASAQEKKVVPTGAMWQKLLHRLAETPAFSGLENAEQARMYKALDYLEDLAKQNEERRRHAKS